MNQPKRALLLPVERTHRRRAVIALLLLGLFVGALVGWNVFKQHLLKNIFANMPTPVVTISSVMAKAQPWQPYLRSIGELKAKNGIPVTAQTAGLVTHLLASAGQMVEKNQPLIQLDDALAQSTLKKQLALLKLAQLNYQRRVKLRKTATVSQAELDQAKANLAEAQANVDHTRVEITHKRIQAPFAGILGLFHVEIGSYISPGIALVSLQSRDPLRITFALPEQHLNQIHIGQIVELQRPDTPQVWFAAKVIELDANIETQTHTLAVKAALNHPNAQLYPGMFVQVRLLLPKQPHAIVLPQTAVIYHPYGDMVYIVDQQHHVKSRYVKLGERRAGKVIVKQGIKAGEQVVSSGQLKLRDGMEVKIDKTHDLH